MTTLDEEDFSSDTSDEDYVPEAEVGSEEEESGDEEVPLLEGEGNEGAASQTSKTKRKKKTKKKKDLPAVRKRQGGIRLEEEKEAAEGEQGKEADDTYNQELGQKMLEEEESKKEEAEKKKIDDLWASFLSDAPPSKPKPKPTASSGLGSLTSIKKTATPTASVIKPTSSATPSTTPAGEPKSDKLTITKEFDFAGETVKVTKEVDIDSTEAKRELKKQEESKNNSALSGRPPLPGKKRPGGGLGNVLGLISKKPKMGTLDKSKMDWEAFKKKEGIEEELQTHNKGKDGYIERQAFLSRADVRQYEIERDIRMGMSGKR